MSRRLTQARYTAAHCCHSAHRSIAANARWDYIQEQLRPNTHTHTQRKQQQCMASKPMQTARVANSHCWHSKHEGRMKLPQAAIVLTSPRWSGALPQPLQLVPKHGRTQAATQAGANSQHGCGSTEWLAGVREVEPPFPSTPQLNAHISTTMYGSGSRHNWGRGNPSDCSLLCHCTPP